MFFKKTAAAWALLCFFAGAACAEVPRGMVLGELMRTLDLPLKTGKTFGDVDESTPYGPALESALSLGILYPADSFSPEIICTNAETLMFALQAMGFRHEAEIARWALPPEDKKLPEYISGYVALAKAVKPAAPASVTADPWGSTSEAQLAAVLRWAERCRDGMAWDCDIARPEGTLHIRRENVGRPPRGWRVQLGVFESEEQARELAQKRNSRDCPVTVTPVDFAFAVTTPLMSDRSDAWAAAKTFGMGKKDSFETLILPESGESEALFWASFTPARMGDAVVRMNAALGLRPMETLSKIAEASGALAAMNGGYFRSGAPIGALHSEGLPVSLPYHNRSMAAWDDRGRAFFGGGEYRVRLSVNGGRWTPVLLNRTVNYGETAVLTPALGTSERRAGNNGFVARVRGSEVVEAVPALQYKTDMQPGEWLIVSRDPDFAVKPGDRAELQTQFREDVPFAPVTAVQAGPLLYAPGHRFWDEMFSPSILRMRHPRTLIGWTGKKLVWLVADGRSSWHSRGLTLEEAAALGRRLGFTALLNLDGGGSSELWWDGHIVNRVSDGRERPMPYGLAVLRQQ